MILTDFLVSNLKVSFSSRLYIVSKVLQKWGFPKKKGEVPISIGLTRLIVNT